VAVVPVLPDGRVVLVRQYRAAVEEENLRIELWPLAQVDELVASGELRDSKSIIGLLLARDHLAREHPGGG
jgi:hypothetical protein